MTIYLRSYALYVLVIELLAGRQGPYLQEAYFYLERQEDRQAVIVQRVTGACSRHIRPSLALTVHWVFIFPSWPLVAEQKLQ